jgi:hypothetical protein
MPGFYPSGLFFCGVHQLRFIVFENSIDSDKYLW